jgi:hypothetical protein
LTNIPRPRDRLFGAEIAVAAPYFLARPEMIMARSERRRVDADPEDPGSTADPQTPSSKFARERAWRESQRPLRPDLTDEQFEGLQRLTTVLERLAR